MGLLDLFSKKKSSIADSMFLQGRTDRHTHILFGVDDGIRQLEDSLAVLRYEESLGVTDVWCTPHVMEDVPNTSSCSIDPVRTRPFAITWAWLYA